MVWINVTFLRTALNPYTLSIGIITHLYGFYGFYLAISGQTDSKTIVYHFICSYFGIIGSLTGAHRLWSHQSYECNRMIKVFLLFCETYIGHNSVYVWTRDHRVHHKYVDTDADPYNVKRGLFFSQMGWIFMKKTKEFREKVRTIDLKDVLGDKLVMFQHNHYVKLLLLQWITSAMIPWYFWDESYFVSACTLLLAYILINVHVGTINSISHFYGWKPYDTGIEPTFSRLVAYLTLGEGYHNFNHTFPKDYSQSELSWTQNFNASALLIDFWEFMGWVSNKRIADPKLIQKRRNRTGDVSVKLQPLSMVLDQIIGVFCFTWALWLIFFVRYTEYFY